MSRRTADPAFPGPVGAIRIVRVGAVHAPVLAALHRCCFAEAWSEVEMAALFATGAFALVALAADEPAGFALARVVLDEGEILALGVVAERRKRTVATKLLAALLEEVARLGATRLVLEVAADNRSARALYAQAGFAQVGRRRGYYGRPGGSPADALILASTVATAAKHPTPCAGAADEAGEGPSAHPSPQPALRSPLPER
jgi:ribosomal-protein-alanine N-acetyltransferase